MSHSFVVSNLTSLGAQRAIIERAEEQRWDNSDFCLLKLNYHLHAIDAWICFLCSRCPIAQARNITPYSVLHIFDWLTHFTRWCCAALNLSQLFYPSFLHGDPLWQPPLCQCSGLIEMNEETAIIDAMLMLIWSQTLTLDIYFLIKVQCVGLRGIYWQNKRNIHNYVIITSN